MWNKEDINKLHSSNMRWINIDIQMPKIIAHRYKINSSINKKIKSIKYRVYHNFLQALERLYDKKSYYK